MLRAALPWRKPFTLHGTASGEAVVQQQLRSGGQIDGDGLDPCFQLGPLARPPDEVAVSWGLIVALESKSDPYDIVVVELASPVGPLPASTAYGLADLTNGSVIEPNDVEYRRLPVLG